MSNKDLEEQIPRENNLDQTENTLQKQSSIAGERRDDEMVHNFPQAASLAQTLKDIEFPTDKKTIIRFLEENRTGIPKMEKNLRFSSKDPQPKTIPKRF